MRNLRFTFTLLVILLSGINLNSQWQLDVNLSNDPLDQLTSLNNVWCVAAIGNYVHVVWHQGSNGASFYKRSSDGGTTWLPAIQLGGPSPCIAVSGSYVHSAWMDYRNGNWEIYYKRSTNSGSTWGQDIRITNNTLFQNHRPSISSLGSSVHIVWEGTSTFSYIHSTDNGTSWSSPSSLSVGTYQSVALSGNYVHVAGTKVQNNFEIFYNRSTDGGISFGQATQLTPSPIDSRYSSIGASGSNVHLVWTDLRDGNEEIYYKRSTDAGLTWDPDIRLTNQPAVSANVSISVSGSNVHIVWQEHRDDSLGFTGEIYYKRSTDNGNTWEPDLRLTGQGNESKLPSVAVSGSSVHVVWYDTRNWGIGNNPEILYKRNPTGNPIGIIIISSEIPNQFSLSQNYPNPFNPISKIKFQISKLADAKLVVYDVLGNEVATLVNEKLKSGTYEVEFDGSNFASGIYYYRFQISDSRLQIGYSETRKMVLIK